MLVVLAAVALLARRRAHAQSAPEPPWNARLWYGADLKVSLIVTDQSLSPGREGTSDLDTMYTLGGVFDVRVLPFVSIGVAPSLILNWAFRGESMLLDLPARSMLSPRKAQ